MNEEPTPEQVRQAAERRELLRQANARIVENHELGRRIADPEALASARRFLKQNPPLGRPLGPGAPEVK